MFSFKTFTLLHVGAAPLNHPPPPATPLYKEIQLRRKMQRRSVHGALYCAFSIAPPSTATTTIIISKTDLIHGFVTSTLDPQVDHCVLQRPTHVVLQ